MWIQSTSACLLRRITAYVNKPASWSVASRGQGAEATKDTFHPRRGIEEGRDYPLTADGGQPLARCIQARRSRLNPQIALHSDETRKNTSGWEALSSGSSEALAGENYL